MIDIEQRITAAIERITSGNAPMRVPADETDPDLVLADCLAEIRRLRAALAARQPVETQLGYTLSDVHEAYSRGKRDAARQPVGLIAQKVGDYRVTVAEDAITVSRGRDIVFAYSAGDPEPINARQPGDFDDKELQFYREHIGNDLDNMLMGAGVFEVTHEGGYEACWANSMDALKRLIDRKPVEFERAIPTRRRESAVELLLQLGFVWNNQRWEDRRQPVGATEQPYNSGGIELTACQLHEALLMAGSPELDVPFEDRSLVRIFWTETGHSGPGLYCECVGAEEEGCILLDGTAPAISQPAQAVDLAENMLSVLIEEGVLARNGRVFQKLRALIDSQAVGK